MVKVDYKAEAEKMHAAMETLKKILSAAQIAVEGDMSQLNLDEFLRSNEYSEFLSLVLTDMGAEVDLFLESAQVVLPNGKKYTLVISEDTESRVGFVVSDDPRDVFDCAVPEPRLRIGNRVYAGPELRQDDETIDEMQDVVEGLLF